jgi:glycosyltransferase involved in cell wall biosynthesis
VRPVNVTHLVTGLSQGGAERQLYLLLQGLDRSKYVPSVLVRHASARDFWTDRIRGLGVPVRELAGDSSAFRRFWGLWRWLRRLEPDIVQGWTLWTNPVMAVLGRLARVPARLGSLRCNLYRAGRGPFERWVTTRGLDRIVANSSKGRRDLLGLGVSTERVELVFNAVETDTATRQFDRAAVRQSWGARDEEVVLATIGNLTRPKNYPMLLEAARELRARGLPLKVVVYGEGPLRAELEAQRQAAGLEADFILCGQHPEARVLVGAADLFGFTSWGEGMANALLEGALAGLPIVTTAVGGADDIVLEGETGFVVPVNDRAAFAQAVERLVTDPERRRVMGARARKRALEEFSQARMVERFHGVYERVLARKVKAAAVS